MKSILFVLMMVFAIPSFADVSTFNLTREQQAQLDAQAAQFRVQNTQDPKKAADAVAAMDPDKLQRYADVGTTIAKAIGAAAKELGVAVNEFIKTPAGILTVILITYQILGAQLLSFFVGMFLLAVVVALYVYTVRRVTLSGIEYIGDGWFRRKRLIKYDRLTFDDYQPKQDKNVASAWPLFWVTLVFGVLSIVLTCITLP